MIFEDFWYTFWTKISKTSKSLKNDFYLIKSHQDQIFRAQIWPKGPDLGFGQITIGDSQNFSKVKKVTFFVPIGFFDIFGPEKFDRFCTEKVQK